MEGILGPQSLPRQALWGSFYDEDVGVGKPMLEFSFTPLGAKTGPASCPVNAGIEITQAIQLARQRPAPPTNGPTVCPEIPATRAVTPSTRGLRSSPRHPGASIARGPTSLPGEQASAPGKPGPGPSHRRPTPKPVDPQGTTARDPEIRLHPPGCGNKPQSPLGSDPIHIRADMSHRAITA